MIMGGEGVHIVETCMFCTVCLYSSCLLICFPFLKFGSITNSHTNNPNSERGKTGPKPWKNKKKSPPRHLSSFSSDPLVSWVDFFFVFSRFLPPWPKNAPKPMEKQKKQVSPHVTCPVSPQTLSMGRFFFCFLEVFATLAQKCPKTHGKTKKKVSPHVTCPASPQTFSWVETFVFLFFLCSRGFCHIGPKMPQNPWKKQNKLRRYPQQPQRFIFTNLFESCCEAKRWKNLSWVSVS